MNPFLSKELANEHIRDLREGSAVAGRRRGGKRSEEIRPDTTIRIRHFAERDIDAVRLLAALDGKHPPVGSVLVAEVEGELVAALPLDGGPVLADPFKPTADVVVLLRQRARQLRELNARKLGGLPARRRLALRW